MAAVFWSTSFSKSENDCYMGTKIPFRVKMLCNRLVDWWIWQLPAHGVPHKKTLTFVLGVYSRLSFGFLLSGVGGLDEYMYVQTCCNISALCEVRSLFLCLSNLGHLVAKYIYNQVITCHYQKLTHTLGDIRHSVMVVATFTFSHSYISWICTLDYRGESQVWQPLGQIGSSLPNKTDWIQSSNYNRFSYLAFINAEFEPS